ncbi:NAD(P)H-binding protein [Nocardioides sp. CER19]|uniref:NAD(P)H-binding protein n=1 Tax=Nocardioides sp. CER19 TaxID=3038538 RepID=UPI00244BCA09|nr:NAD(P)H-binding protein [Nocardioides sp. CER19]MDH2414885.1 NAD(P)H-binding protein [Nocardioides sp. CER19]
MAKVIILGGHGKVALRLAPLLVELGDQVTSVFRNPDHQAAVAATGAHPVLADIETLDTAHLADLLRGQDAVVWSAGAGGGDPVRTFGVDQDAAIRSIDAAEAAGVQRYVMVSYLGARPDHGFERSDPFFAYAEAKARADEHLRRSSLAFTIVGPGHLTLDEPTGRIDVVTAETAGRDTAVSRADVAAVVAAVLHDDATVGRSIEFRNGATPIADAIRG